MSLPKKDDPYVDPRVRKLEDEIASLKKQLAEKPDEPRAKDELRDNKS